MKVVIADMMRFVAPVPYANTAKSEENECGGGAGGTDFELPGGVEKGAGTQE